MNESVSDLRIAVVHNKIMPYRRPFFERISEDYDVELLIFDDDDVREGGLNIRHVDHMSIYRQISSGKYDLVVNPDIVFHEALVALVASKRTDTKIVQWTEVWNMPDRSLYERLKTATLFRIADQWIDSYIVPGMRSKEYLLRHTAVNATQIQRVSNASHLDKTKHSSGISRSDLGISSNDHVVLYIGQIIERKGIDTLLHAAQILENHHDNLTILICGSGDDEYLKKLKMLKDRLNLESVQFYGWVDQSELYDFYALSDVYTILSRRDPFPLSVVEAMSTGTPTVVSTGVGEAYDLVRDGETGYVVRAERPDDVASAITEILADENHRNELGKNAEELIKTVVGYDNMLQGLEQSIEKAFSDRRKTTETT